MSSSTTTPANTTWSCAQCSATFGKSKLLERHALQTSHKAYKCLQCPKVFGKRTALIRHKTVHSDVKSHVCRVCEKAFYRKDHCAEHEEVCTHRLAVETKARLSASLAESIGSAFGSRESATSVTTPLETDVDHAFESGSNRKRQASGDGETLGTLLSRVRQRPSSVQHLAGSERSKQQSTIDENVPSPEQQGSASGVALPSGRDAPLVGHSHSSWSDLDQNYASSRFDWNVVDTWTPTKAQVPSKSTSREPTAAHLRDNGTYTCTYHGCTQRFDNPSSLQRHKRDFHRAPPLENGSRRRMSPPAIRIGHALRVSGGQPVDRRLPPLTVQSQAGSSQPSATDPGNGDVARAVWRELIGKWRAQQEQDALEEGKDDSSERDRSSTLPLATNSRRSAIESASRRVDGSFGGTLTGEAGSLREASTELAMPDLFRFDTTSSSYNRLSPSSHWVRQPRILLAEYDPTCRRIASKFLHSFDCVVETAVTAVEVVDQVGWSNLMEIDLIFMNSLWFEESSVHFSRQTQAPIIKMGSDKPAQDIKACLYTVRSASGVLPKPFTKEGMFRQLERHLQHLILRKSTDTTSSSAAVAPRAQGPLDKLAPAFF